MLRSFVPAVVVVLVLGSLLVPPPAAAQPRETALEAAFELEGRLLDGALERYGEAREREGRARDRVGELAQELDRALADEQVGVAELRRRERELAEARETAALRARESAELREAIYGQMERLGAVQEELDSLRERDLVETAELDGEWELRMEPLELVGLMELELDGTLVTGTYRLDNGSRGSLRGTFAEGVLRLDRIDAGRGFDAFLRGELDPARGVIEGVWQSVDVTGGAASAGDWAARKLAPAGGG